MKFGLFSINNYVCSDPAVGARVALAAEAAGFDSVWTGEHVVLPDPQVAPSPVAPEVGMLDPVVALTFIAARTTTIKLGTGIIILPQRNPLVLAKELASLDVASEGRLLFGVGVGYLQPEFAALGIPMDDRGARTEEYLEAMHAIWDMEQPEYSGRYVSFRGIQANPRPHQRPTPPIVMGGRGKAAFRRTVTHAHGWYGFGIDVAATQSCLAGLAAAQSSHERPERLGKIEISVSPRGPVDAAQAAEFAALGVDRLILVPGGGWDEARHIAYVEEIGATLVGQY